MSLSNDEESGRLPTSLPVGNVIAEQFNDNVEDLLDKGKQIFDKMDCLNKSRDTLIPQKENSKTSKNRIDQEIEEIYLEDNYQVEGFPLPTEVNAQSKDKYENRKGGKTRFINI